MKTAIVMIPWLACAAAGCAADPTAVTSTDEAASRSLCPGHPPPPIECSTVICLGGDASWEYEPLDVGTPCNGGAGLCNGEGTCVAIPPVHQTLAVEGSLFSAGVAAVLSGTVFALDTTGNGVPLITGHHTECTQGPGGIGLICVDIAESHQTYLHFSDALKAQVGATDFVFDVSPFCNWFTCVNVNQVHGDLGATQVEFAQTSSGAQVKVIVPITSGHPTFIIDLAPDVDLTDVESRSAARSFPTARETGSASCRPSRATSTSTWTPESPTGSSTSTAPSTTPCTTT